MQEIDYYKNNSEITEVYIEAKRLNIVPRVIHRILLYDNDFPKRLQPYLRQFRIHNKEFTHVLWKEEELLSIMNEHELSVYNSYKKNIQKADYGRYIVLKYFGGIYLDFDIKFIKPLISFYEAYKNHDLFFEENTLKEVNNYSNETPCSLRIANYIMWHKPNSKHIEGILAICDKRKLLPIYMEQDVIYTTGPDVTSAYVDKNRSIIKWISKKEYSRYLLHFHAGHWRFNLKDRK